MRFIWTPVYSTEQDKAVYRKSFLEPGEGRRPTIAWPRQIVVNGEPKELYDVEKAYSDWLLENEIPKLFFSGDPGSMITAATRAFPRSFKNQTEVMVKGRHFLQEEDPDTVGKALSDWLEALG